MTQDGHDLNAEAILALDPTVIITDTSLGPWDVVLQMRDSGIPVVVVDSHRGLDNVADLIHAVADPLGVPEAGDALADRTQQEIDDVTAQIAKVAPADQGERLRTVFLYVRGQSGIYYMFGEGSGADSLIEAIGGYDVAERDRLERHEAAHRRGPDRRAAGPGADDDRRPRVRRRASTGCSSGCPPWPRRRPASTAASSRWRTPRSSASARSPPASSTRSRSRRTPRIDLMTPHDGHRRRPASGPSSAPSPAGSGCSVG